MMNCSIKYVSISLLLQVAFVYSVEFVGISGKNLLHATSRGKDVQKAIDKEADKLIQELDKKKEIVVKAEKNLQDLQSHIQKLADKYQAEGMTDEHDIELNILLDQYEAKQRELVELNEILQSKVAAYKNYLRLKRVEKLSSFDQDVIQRYAPLQGWDMIFSKDHRSVLYISKKLDETEQLIRALDKQMATKDKVYTTKEEVKQLFNDLGIVYLDSSRVDSDVSGNINAFYTEHYEKNKAALDGDRLYFLPYVKEYHRAPFCVKWVSDKVGFGVFAIKDIKRGDFVQEYAGVLREQRSDRGLPFDPSYAWNYPSVGAYNFNSLSVDSKYEGNEMRFVNHSNHPNTKMIYVLDDKGVYHVCYLAIQDIKPGEQITVSYGINYWQSREFFEDL